MRYLIVSDLHGNREALEAVLHDARGGYDRAVCCGDLCDYGPDSAYTIDWARTQPAAVIRGNHDRICAGLDSMDDFTPLAQASALWTMEHLSSPDRNYLRELPRGPMPVDDALVLVHGAPHDEDEYVTNVMEAGEVFGRLAGTEHVELPHFFGHTHLQGAFVRSGGRIHQIGKPGASEQEARIALEPGAAWLINPGAVGQPRDGDPRAAYAIFDTAEREVALRRVPYDLAVTQRKIEAAGLPPRLATRLASGK
ncbi:MAG TPA: metallophosphoesterase family protein [Bryobacteraceae bacterium]